MIYSKYQTNIFKAIENTNHNIASNAVAGSGKTTTIVEACKLLEMDEKEVKFLAFNNLIADELKVKLKGYADVSTLHSFGLSILRRLFNMPEYGYKVKIDSWRYHKYVKQNLNSLSSAIGPDVNDAKIYGFCCNCQKIMELARVNLIKHGDKKALNALCDEHNIITMFDEINVCDILLAKAYEMPSDLTIDFTDMIVLPLKYKEYIPTFSYVFIDECQDLNRAQRELMLCAAKDGRFIAVGDRNQAINGFAGADCKSFDKIASLPNTIELPLSVNYRCGTNMVKLAKEIVPQIIAHDGAIAGTITDANKMSKSLFKPNDMVLCRTTAPLVGVCMNLIQNGITAIVKGKDIADGLINLVERANTNSIEDVLDYLNEEKRKLIATIMKERSCDAKSAMEAMKYKTLDDRCKCIENICLYSLKNTKELKSYINKIFSDKNIKNAVVLSTAHKSKGLENDRVLLLLPEKMPLKWRGQRDWQYTQELNLKYVALTRAKKELVFVNINETALTKRQILK